MNLQHKVKINVSDRNGNQKTVLKSTTKRLPKKLLHFLFGEFCEVLVLTLGETVETVEIHEIRGDKKNGQ